MVKTFPTISVIIPVYKVELYLRQCINSILAQTYSNLEIILIDDGSPDDCGKICDEYAKKDNRIKVIHKKNEGLSEARNSGIDTATGEYLTFVDSDDWIEIDMIEVLYNNLVNNNADISCCGYAMVYTNSTKYLNNEKNLVLDKEQAIKEIFVNKKLNTFFWGKLYKKHIFNKIRLPSGKHYEDVFVIVDILLEAHICTVYPVSKYYYRQRKGSIVNSAYNPKIMNVIEAAERNLKIISSNYPDIIEFANASLLKANLDVLARMIVNMKHIRIPEYKKVLSTVRQNYKIMLKSDVLNWNKKIKVLAIKINIRLYKLLQLINDRKRNKMLFD
jgi:glycosyltransferase involved in cell wall biosynthesis